LGVRSWYGKKTRAIKPRNEQERGKKRGILLASVPIGRTNRQLTSRGVASGVRKRKSSSGKVERGGTGKGRTRTLLVKANTAVGAHERAPRGEGGGCRRFAGIEGNAESGGILFSQVLAAGGNERFGKHRKRDKCCDSVILAETIGGNFATEARRGLSTHVETDLHSSWEGNAEEPIGTQRRIASKVLGDGPRPEKLGERGHNPK